MQCKLLVLRSLHYLQNPLSIMLVLIGVQCMQFIAYSKPLWRKGCKDCMQCWHLFFVGAL